MRKRKKTAFPSREAYDAWRASIEARIQELRAHAARIDAELAAKRKPAA
jgi:hypothetical protein